MPAVARPLARPAAAAGPLMALALSCGLAAPGAAHAGSGPWVQGPGALSVYAGGEYQRINELAGREGLGDPSVIAVDDGIETTGLKLIASYGLVERVELELDLPWSHAQANRPGPVCASLGPKTCAPTQGIGVVAARVKGLLLDELYGSPVSLSVAGVARFGQTTARTRDRVTNLGEGTQDLGGGLALGRSGGLREGFWSGYVDATGLYRFSNVADASPGVPAWEYSVNAEFLAGTRAWWSLGPSVSFWHRPEGIDVEDLLSDATLATDVDRFARLRARSTRVGGKLLLRADSRTTLALGAATTVAAVNNPRVFTLSAGVAVYPRLRGAPEGG